MKMNNKYLKKISISTTWNKVAFLLLFLLGIDSQQSEATCPGYAGAEQVIENGVTYDVLYFGTSDDYPASTEDGSPANPLTDFNSSNGTVDALNDCNGEVYMRFVSCYYTNDVNLGDIDAVRVPTVDDVIIDGQGAFIEVSGASIRFLTCDGLDNWTIRNLTFTGFNQNVLLLTDMTNTTIENCIFDGNPTQRAVRVDNDDNASDVTFSNCLFSNNPPVSETPSTGAVEVREDEFAGPLVVTFNDCDFDCNARQGFGGGGLWISPVSFPSNNGPQVLINGGSFVNNFSGTDTGDGGAIGINGEDSFLDIDGTLFSCNYSEASTGDGGGGAIRIQAGPTVTIDNSTFYGNYCTNSAGSIPAGGYGGSININSSASNTSTLTITNSTFTGNQASRGGAFYLESGIVSFDNVLVTGNNSATDPGGGVNNAGATFTIMNTSIAGNTPDDLAGAVTDNGGAPTVTDPGITECEGCAGDPFCEPSAGTMNLDDECLFLCVPGNTPAGTTSGGQAFDMVVDNFMAPCVKPEEYKFYFLVVDASGNIVDVVAALDSDGDGIPNVAETPAIPQPIDFSALPNAGALPSNDYFIHTFHYPCDQAETLNYFDDITTTTANDEFVTNLIGTTITDLMTAMTMPGNTVGAGPRVACGAVSPPSPEIVVLESIIVTLTTQCAGSQMTSTLNITGGYPQEAGAGSYTLSGTGEFGATFAFGSGPTTVNVTYVNGNNVTVGVTADGNMANNPADPCIDCLAPPVDAAHTECQACPDIVDGTLAVTGPATAPNVCTGDMVTVCVEVDLTNDPMAMVEFSNDGGTNWSVGTLDPTATPPVFCFDFTETNTTSCNPITVSYQARFNLASLDDNTCDLDLQTMNATPAAVSVDVYPDVATLAMPMLANDGTCGPSLTINCPNYTITNDYDGNGANPNFSTETGSGNVIFTITNPATNVPTACATTTVNATYGCCPDIIDGTLSATANAAPATDVCTGSTVTVCVDVDLINDLTATVEFSNDGGTTWNVGTLDNTTNPNTFCFDFVETNTTSCDPVTVSYQAQFNLTSLGDPTCDQDLQTMDATPATVSVDVYPDVATLAMPMLANDGACGPSLTINCPNYTISNDYDGNGANPDFSLETGMGNIIFTITNPATNVPTACATAMVNATYNCVSLCPDIVDGTLSATANAAPAIDVCTGSTITVCVDVDLTNDPTATVEFSNNGGTTWNVGTLDNTANPNTFCFDFVETNTTSCNPIPVSYQAQFNLASLADNACSQDLQTADTGGNTVTVDVYPDVATVAMPMLNNDGTCGPSLTINCPNYTVTNDYDGNGANPDFSAEAGSGNIIFTVTNPDAGVPTACSTTTINGTYGCCPDIIDGTLSATANAAPATDICSGNTVTVCVDVDLMNDLTATVEFSNDGGATWNVGTLDNTANPNTFCFDFVETNTSSCNPIAISYQAQFNLASLGDPTCSQDLQTMDATPTTVTVNVYPDVATVAMPMLANDGTCGPSLTISCPNYTISNDYDANGGNPDFSAETGNGNIIFTITNPDTNVPTACADTTIAASYGCLNTCTDCLNADCEHETMGEQDWGTGLTVNDTENFDAGADVDCEDFTGGVGDMVTVCTEFVATGNETQVTVAADGTGCNSGTFTYEITEDAVGVGNPCGTVNNGGYDATTGQIDPPLQAGTTYQYCVTVDFSTDPNCDIDNVCPVILECTQTPPNDDICDVDAANTWDLTVGTPLTNQDNLCATLETGEPTGGEDQSVWYTYTVPPGVEAITVATSNNTFNTILTIYTATLDCSNPPTSVDLSVQLDMPPVAQNDDATGAINGESEATFCVEVGTTYYIQVDGNAPDEEGFFDIEVTDATGTTNCCTDCLNADCQNETMGEQDWGTGLTVNDTENFDAGADVDCEDFTGIIGDIVTVCTEFVATGNETQVTVAADGTGCNSGTFTYEITEDVVGTGNPCGTVNNGGYNPTTGEIDPPLQAGTTYQYCVTVDFTTDPNCDIDNVCPVILDCTQTPPNDDICDVDAANTWDLTIGTPLTNQDNFCATLETGEPTGGADQSVWYTYTVPPGVEAITVATSNNDFNTILTIYTATLDCSNPPSSVDLSIQLDMPPIAQNDDATGATNGESSATVCVEEGTTYYIQVDGNAPDEEGNFDIEVTDATGTISCCTTTPPNDDICNAVDLSTTGGATNQDNICATTETGETGGGGDQSVWYTYTVPPGVDGISIETLNNNFNTTLTTYSGTPNCAGGVDLSVDISMIPGGSNDDNPNGATNGESYVELCVEQGDVIYIQVDGNATGEEGNFDIDITDVTGTIVCCTTTPSNDDICNAVDLSTTNGVINQNNICATTETNETDGGNDQTVWYTYTVPPGVDAISIETLNNNFNTTLTTYTGTPNCAGVVDLSTDISLIPNGSNDDNPNGAPNGESYVEFCVGQGDVIHIQVDGNTAGEEGNFDIQITDQTGNINCACTLDYIVTPSSQGNQGGISPFYFNYVDVDVFNGTPPYTYFWYTIGYVRHAIINTDDSNPNGAQEIRAIYADNAVWTVTVTDANGCQIIATNDPAIVGGAGQLLDIYNYTITPDRCQTPTNYEGNIDIDVEGGSPPYTYQWAGPYNWTGATTASTDVISSLPSGWYSVTVTDSATPPQITEGWYWVACQGPGRGKLGATTHLQVYPNPLAEVATIEFVVDQTAQAEIENGQQQATLALFNVDGRKIRNIFAGKVNSGANNQVTFHTEDLPTGVYILQLQTNSGLVQHKKLIISK